MITSGYLGRMLACKTKREEKADLFANPGTEKDKEAHVSFSGIPALDFGLAGCLNHAAGGSPAKITTVQGNDKEGPDGPWQPRHTMQQCGHSVCVSSC